MREYKTEVKHFKMFQKECEKWIRYFGLQDWAVLFEHVNQDGEGREAYVIHTSGDRTATFGLYIEWMDLKPTNERIRQTAFHEVCELLLSELSTTCRDRYIREQDIHTAIHNVVHRLENSVFKSVKAR